MWQKGTALFIAGILLIVIGSFWDVYFPINKRLWTSSFVLCVGGWSMLFLSVFYLIIDVAGYRKWAFPFVLIGVNSILIYLASESIINFKHTADFVFGGIIQYAAAGWQPVFAAVSIVLIQLALLYFLYRNKIFLKYNQTKLPC